MTPADGAAGLRGLAVRLARPDVLGHPVAHVRVLETHISCVLLTGEWAYKFKKPVDLGFLDFSTLASRRTACLEELRLNRRLAATIYDRVVAITGDPAEPTVDGAGPAFEYAVRMREFPQAALAPAALIAGGLHPGHVEDLGSRLGAFHAGAPVAPADRRWGDVESVAAAVRDAGAQVGGAGVTPASTARLEAVKAALASALAGAATRIAARRGAGRVREGHGDLHLGNLVLLDGHLVPFDCIEFNADLRWGDVAADLAFPCMDFAAHGRADLATDLLGAWVGATGDADAVALLPLYGAYRALVRAKVAALAAVGGADVQDCAAGVERYLGVAGTLLAPRPPPVLVLMHGLSGAGKSRIARDLAVALDALRLRADIERKRLAGLPPAADSRAVGLDLYTPAMHRRTYDSLLSMTADALGAGRDVVVDATFLRRDERGAFRALGDRLGIATRIVAVEAPRAVLEARIRRRAAGTDPSEADCAVLAAQMGYREPLDPQEQTLAIVVDNAGVPPACEPIAARLRARLPPAAT